MVLRGFTAWDLRVEIFGLIFGLGILGIWFRDFWAEILG